MGFGIAGLAVILILALFTQVRESVQVDVGPPIQRTATQTPSTKAATTSYTVTVDYTTTTTQWENANWISQQVTTDNRNGMRAEGRSPTSPDGKWWASEKTATLQVSVAGTKERLTNASFTFVSGAGAFTETSGPNYSEDARTVTATVKGWSGSATYELKAQIERETDVSKENTHSLLIKENPFTLYVPQTAINARFTMAYDNRLLTVTMGQTSDPLIFVSKLDNGPVIEYTYRIK